MKTRVRVFYDPLRVEIKPDVGYFSIVLYGPEEVLFVRGALNDILSSSEKDNYRPKIKSFGNDDWTKL